MNATAQRNQPDELDAAKLAAEFEHRKPQELLAWAVARFGSRLGICSSFQAEGCVLTDMARRIDCNIRVFTIDTGRHPEETHALAERVRERYRIPIEVFMPDAQVAERMVARHGNNLFYRDAALRRLCCHVRKVMPLGRALSNFDAWITGLRRDQCATRSNIRKVERDHDHGGILKLAPLADWTDRQVWDYIGANRVPYNTLYDRGYRSIGCAPCTRAVAAGQDSRAGRWWWEGAAAKECGMHCAVGAGNVEYDLATLLNGGSHDRRADGSPESARSLNRRGAR